MKNVIVGLIAGRHQIPVSEYIYTGLVNPTDFAVMQEVAYKFVRDHVGADVTTAYAPNQQGLYTEPAEGRFGRAHLTVYVTGLTAALAAVVNACAYYGVNVTLMHFDRESGQYLPQELFLGRELIAGSDE